MSIEKILNRRLQDEYKRLKLYLNDKKCCQELHKMCNRCEEFLGTRVHNYEDCKDKECFKFYLAYAYLRCCIGYELFN